MINKYTNKQRGLLAVVLAIAMMFAGAAFVAAEVDATGATELDEDTHVVSLKQNETTTYYADFKTAWDYAVSQNADFTIDLLKDTNSDGVKTTSTFTSNITLNLNDHILTFGPNGAGSKGTETSAFQLLKQTTSVTINGGDEGKGMITSGGEENSSILRMIQNYTTLTLIDVTIDGSKMLPGNNPFTKGPMDYYTITNGNVLIKGTTSIIAHAVESERDSFAISAGQIEIETVGSIGKIQILGDSLTIKSIGSNDGIIIGSEDTFDINIKTKVTTEVIIPEGVIANGNIEFFQTSAGETGLNVSGLKAGSGGITISEGSYVIEGVVDLSSNTNIAGDVTLKNVVFVTTNTKNDSTTNGVFSSAGKITIEGNVIIPAGVSIDAGSIEVATGASLNFGGYTDDNIDNKGTIIITTLDAEIGGVIGDGSIDTSGVASEGTLSGTFDTNTDFTQNQIITITGDTYLVEDTIFTFSGKLIIPEGVTLYIQDTAKVVIDTYAGYLENNGTIVVESKCGSLEIRNQANAVNNGTILLDYTAVADDTNQEQSMIIDSKFTNNGVITVGEDSAMVILSSGFVNSADAVMDIYGIIEARDIINNAGTPEFGTLIMNI